MRERVIEIEIDRGTARISVLKWVSMKICLPFFEKKRDKGGEQGRE